MDFTATRHLDLEKRPTECSTSPGEFFVLKPDINARWIDRPDPKIIRPQHGIAADRTFGIHYRRESSRVTIERIDIPRIAGVLLGHSGLEAPILCALRSSLADNATLSSRWNIRNKKADDGNRFVYAVCWSSGIRKRTATGQSLSKLAYVTIPTTPGTS